MNDARDLGMIAFIFAGSHSPIDVCIVDANNKVIRLIQCKPDDISDNKKKVLKSKYAKLNDLFTCTFEVI